MKAVGICLVMGILLSPQAQGQPAPLSEAQRVQLRERLDGMTRDIARVEEAVQNCPGRGTPAGCAQWGQQLENMRGQQRKLCRALDLPAGQAGCP